MHAHRCQNKRGNVAFAFTDSRERERETEEHAMRTASVTMTHHYDSRERERERRRNTGERGTDPTSQQEDRATPSQWPSSKLNASGIMLRTLLR